MGNSITCCFGVGPDQTLSPEELDERRTKAAEAAEQRSKKFSQGGGGEKLKEKAKKLEEYEQKNKEIGGPSPLRWQVG